jgi:hypothetical protein
VAQAQLHPDARNFSGAPPKLNCVLVQPNQQPKRSFFFLNSFSTYVEIEFGIADW